MSNAQGIRAGRAYVELFADGRALAAGLTAAGQRLRQFGSQVRAAGIAMGLAGAALMAPFAASIKAYIDAARDGKLAGADLAKAVGLQTAINETKNAILGLEVAIGSDLAPTLIAVAKLLAGAINNTKAWVRENPGAATAIGLVSAAVAGLGIALVGLGVSIQITAFAFAGLGAAASSALGLILSPAILVSAAIGAIGYAIATQTKAGRKGLAWLGEGFAQVADDAKVAWGGIGDAMASGDMAGAVKMAWAFIKLEWTVGKNWLLDSVQSMATSISKSFLDVGFAINYSFRYVLTKVGNVLDELDARVSNSTRQMLLLGERRYGNKEYNAMAKATGSAALRTGPETTPAQATDSRNADLQDFKNAWDSAKQSLDKWNVDSQNKRADETDQLRKELDELARGIRERRISLEHELEHQGGILESKLKPVRESKADVFGTFSAAASFGIGIGSTAADRTAKASEQAAKELKEINGKFDKITSATFIP